MSSEGKRRLIAICGDSGSGKTTLSNLLLKNLEDAMVLECDRYHKWERGHEEWKKTSQLNPKANHLDIMSEDFHQLKKGLSIFREDYDHKDGKFTEKQTINPSKNIIACGLHTFKCDDSLYDLKVFMNPDEDLRLQWKTARDIRKRGYTTSQALDQITSREKDRLLFIKPYINESDLIVSFCTDKNIPHMDSVKGLGRSLRVFINNNYNIITLKYKLCDLESRDVSPSSIPGFHEMLICECKYEYVVMCILYLLGAKCD